MDFEQLEKSKLKQKEKWIWAKNEYMRKKASMLFEEENISKTKVD